MVPFSKSKVCITSNQQSLRRLSLQTTVEIWMNEKWTNGRFLYYSTDVDTNGCPIIWYIFIFSCFRPVDYLNKTFQNISQMTNAKFKWHLILNSYFKEIYLRRKLRDEWQIKSLHFVIIATSFKRPVLKIEKIRGRIWFL